MLVVRRGDIGLVAVAIVMTALGTVAGCGSRAAIQEMNQQEAEIRTEHDEWQRDLDAWKRGIAELRAVSAPHPEKVDPQKLSSYEERVQKHARELLEYQRDLDAFETRVERQMRLSEHERLDGHAALYGEHLKLELRHGALATAHEELQKERASFDAAVAAR
jgi:hypothetical protein